ncbi:MAG: GHKL domain-containing protein [Oscillospiraceae bacterium]|nr:GHKL domain-containing protein [Oscillospiraceae bacterium]
MNKIKAGLQKLKNAERETLLLAALILVCGVCITVFLRFYFDFYDRPYTARDVIDLSEGWRYSAGGSDPVPLETLRTGPGLAAGEVMTLYRTLEEETANAVVLIRANHQTAAVFLDGEPLYADAPLPPGQNPGMALHFIPLPADYRGKTLSVELISPYALYSGRTGPILLGTAQSLEAFTLSQSMRSVILMAMCLLVGLLTIALTLVQALFGSRRPENLAIGAFAVVWALYYVCTEYIVFLFFPPFWMSALSLGLYFLFQGPLTLYFYLSFRHYKKWMLPAVILHNGFPAAAILLQIAGVTDLPRLLNLNNLLLTGLAYTVVLAALEAVKRNRVMLFALPLLSVAYISMLMNFSIFYARHGVPPYSYRDSYFLLILCVLGYNIQQFFRLYYRGQQENETLALQHRLAADSNERLKLHLQEVGGLKHEMRNHLAALQTYLRDGRYGEAEGYLEKYAGQAAAVTEGVHHEHYIINALAGELLHRAEEAGIRTELHLKASPVRVTGPDLYSLLSNILNNALEACARLPEGEERFIRLSVIRREPYFTVICTNSWNGRLRSENGVIRSAKEEQGHGYGLWTIKRIAEAYNGLTGTEYNRHTFTLTAALRD